MSRSAAALLLTIALGAAPASASWAIYEVRFQWSWGGRDGASGVLPLGAHFTELVGATHPAGVPLFEVGGYASLGVEQVAERGNTAVLEDEIDVLLEAGLAGETIVADEIGPSFPVTTRTFTADLEHPSVTLLAMVAPSPDWFVGVSDLSLRDASGWIEAVSLYLAPLDAGTEDGSGFSLDNPDSDPYAPITAIVGGAFAGSPPLALLAFELVEAPEPGATGGALAAMVALALRRVTPCRPGLRSRPRRAPVAAGSRRYSRRG
jgi:hypothetical protein